MTDERDSRDEGRSPLRRRAVIGALGGTGLAALAGLPGALAQEDETSADEGTSTPDGDGTPTPTPESERSEQTATWSVEAAKQIERTAGNTPPVFGDLPEVAPNMHVWDSWPLRNRDGSVACVNGWMVLFSLTSPDALLPGKRHDVAEIRYFYSRDGQDWRMGGQVFVPGRPIGNRQWASSAVYDQETDEVFMFYTATGDESVTTDPSPPSPDLTYKQRLALAEGVTLRTSTTGVDFDGVWEHSLLLEADGEYYQTMDQSGDGIIYAFRDPWYFQDPNTGEEYLIFEGNTPIDDGETPCKSADLEEGDYLSGVAAGGAQFNGNVGIATKAGDDMSEWELQPPLLDSTCVNQQLERGNIVVMDDKYYLFFDSHKFTFADGIEGPDGMYGFVADSLRGDYEPLNGSGLVIGNPEEAPFQAYSWMPMPYSEGKIAVTSYDNYNDLPEDTDLRGLRDLPPEAQQEAFGGTLAPTLILEVEDDQTNIVDIKQPGFIPSECSNPPLPTDESDEAAEENGDADDDSASGNGDADDDSASGGSSGGN
jgi:levansucrase